MGKRRFTEDGWKKDLWYRALANAILSCKTEADLDNFLRDIGTLSELQAWSERLEVAKQLARGLSYRQVAENTGASTTTVTRVAKFIENGEGGYRKILRSNRHHREAPEVKEMAEGVKAEHVQEQMKENGVQTKPVSVLQKYLGR